jgi:hypothetical protein
MTCYLQLLHELQSACVFASVLTIADAKLSYMQTSQLTVFIIPAFDVNRRLDRGAWADALVSSKKVDIHKAC